MQRTSFGEMRCSIARTLDVAGEPWSPLILRDIWVGITSFAALQRNLGISSKVLAERLKWLTGHGLLERRADSERPHRAHYVLTAKGLEFCSVLLAICAWGDRWAADEAGPPALFRHRGCGQITHAELTCAQCGQPLHAGEVEVEPGAAA